MKNLLLIIMLSLTFSGSLWAQKVILIKATEQRWAGGPVGRHGSNYHISFKAPLNIKADSFYVTDRVYPLTIGRNGSLTIDSVQHIFNISISQVYNRGAEVNSNGQPNASRQLNGEALIIYTYKGKKHSLSISKFEQLKFLAYP